MSTNSNPNEAFNKFAAERFAAAKSKMKFDLGVAVSQNIALEKNTKPITLTQEKIDQLMDEPISRYPEEQRDQLVAVAGEVEFVDDAFKFINKLELSPNLSLAIGLIISGGKTGDLADIEKAYKVLYQYLSGKQGEI